MANLSLKITPAAKFPAAHPRYLPFLIAKHSRYAKRVQVQQVAERRCAEARTTKVILRRISTGAGVGVSL